MTTLHEAIAIVSKTMDRPFDWGSGGFRRSFGDQENPRRAPAELEVRIHTEMVTMKVSLRVRVTFRQTSCGVAEALGYAALAIEASAMALEVEGLVGELSWTHDDHQALYANAFCRHPHLPEQA